MPSTETPPPSSVLVLGAGELGSEVLKSLASHPARGTCKISLLLRPSTIASPSPAKRVESDAYRDAGIEFVEGDIGNPSTTVEELAEIFGRFEVVVGCTGMTFPSGTQLKITRAMLLADRNLDQQEAGGGKKKIRYFPWQFGIDYDRVGRESGQDLFDEQLEVRDILRAQDEVDWVVVSTGMFVSFLFEEAFGVVDMAGNGGGGRVVALGSWENALTVTAVEDIGRIVAELVLVDVQERGVVYVAGDTVSMKRLADVTESIVGKEVQRAVKTVDQLKMELREDGGRDAMKKYRVVFANGVGVSWDREGCYNVKKGVETVRFEEWASRNVKPRGV
jgi:NmrA-like family